LRHEIFLFLLQFSATLTNLAQNGKMFHDIPAHKANLPKMGKCFTTILGLSDWSQHCYWHSCLSYGPSRRHRGTWWAQPNQTTHQPPTPKL